MTLESLLAWWNVIYLLPFGLALVYLFAYSASGWTFGDADVEHDVGADVDADVDAEIEAGVEVGGPEVNVPDLGGEAGPDAAVEPDHDISHDAAHSHSLNTPGRDIDVDTDPTATKSIFEALAWVGLGRVPLSILLMVLFLSFGTIGFITNQALRDWLDSGLVALVSLPIAVLGALGITSAVAQSIARWMPLAESSARHRRELVGLRATAVFAVDEGQGVAMVREPGGDRYQVSCRTLPGRPSIAGGTEVVLVKYAESRGVFYVVPSDLEVPGRPAEGLLSQGDSWEAPMASRDSLES